MHGFFYEKYVRLNNNQSIHIGNRSHFSINYLVF